MTLREIKDSLGGYMSYLPQRPGQIHRDSPSCGAHDHWHQCHEDVCFKAKEHGHVETNDLAALAKQGLVIRTKEGRSVLWSWEGQLVDMGDIEDFPTPTEEDLAQIEASERITELTDSGVEIQWIEELLKSKDGREWTGGVQLRRNGPLRTFRIHLWEGATSSQLVDALTAATSLMSGEEGRLADGRAWGVGLLEQYS